jgi:hypothetical protein
LATGAHTFKKIKFTLSDAMDVGAAGLTPLPHLIAICSPASCAPFSTDMEFFFPDGFKETAVS